MTYDYERWFGEPPSERHPVIEEAMAVADGSGLADHDFFRVAATSRHLLTAWVAQELVVTGPFSQALLSVAALVDNVHLRSAVVHVAQGEHGRVRHGLAPAAHPCLLDKLRESLGLPVEAVLPLPATERFLNDLQVDILDLLPGLASTGVGNERLILAEYTAVKAAFAACWPTSAYERFLDANINEDDAHSAILGDVASALIRTDDDAERYFAAATRSVTSRLTYYDDMLQACGA